MLEELEAIVIIMVQEIREAKIGTGGLLIIYGNKINNNNVIESNGVSAIYATDTGGSSGGGSINLFYNENYNNNGTISAYGGTATKGYLRTGGAGGTGTITVGSIKIGDYENIDVDGTYKIIEIQEDNIELVKILNDESVVGNNQKEVQELIEYKLPIIKRTASGQITWKSSDENIVTVDQNGTIKFINSGTAIITCTIKTKTGIEYTDSCEVTAAERLYLYYYGNQFTSITGGYEKCARTGRRFSATFNNDNIYIDCNAGYGGGGVFTVNSIDLTQYKYLKSYGEVASCATSDSAGRLMATTTSKTWGSSSVPADYVTVSSTGKTTELLTLTHDIESLQSSYYICNGFNQSHGYLYEIWLEK